MSKAVLISIRPEWCERIASKLKTVEVRKSRPKIKPPFKCYIYCTKFKYGEILCFPQQKTGKVIGEFVCDEVEEFAANPRTTHLIQTERIARASNLGMEALVVYGLDSPRLYSWHISDLVIYPEPKELSDFIPNCRYGQDGECTGVSEVDCPFQKRDYNPDGRINIVDCAKRVSRAPQSWCYVEEQK